MPESLTSSFADEGDFWHYQSPRRRFLFFMVEKIIPSDAFLGPWRPAGDGERVSSEHMAIIGEIPHVPVRVYGHKPDTSRKQLTSVVTTQTSQEILRERALGEPWSNRDNVLHKTKAPGGRKGPGRHSGKFNHLIF
ncbi:MAG: hypothetical protein ABH816_00115 [Candidatus Levyibacteriota bacterium]